MAEAPDPSVRIAVSMGDPAGIGPEVVLKALREAETASLARWVIVGDRRVLDQTATAAGFSLASLQGVDVIDADALGDRPVVSGLLDAAYGGAAIEYVREATTMCLDGRADAIVTAPVNKEAVALSGVPFSGHTEYIARMCGRTDSRMMLTNRRLSVVHVTTHVALREACNASVARIERTIALGHEAMSWLGIESPRIAVCGLNPHAGEHGLFGHEDVEVVRPAIAAARAAGIRCDGPFSPDTLFRDAWLGRWDLLIAMYHDQGHIPMKLLDFASTVNVTLGIPIVRTSVDHGTAFDIAGQNRADFTNMTAALRLAAAMARRRTASRIPTTGEHTR